MRLRIVASVLVCAAAGSFPQQSNPTKLAEIPIGVLAGNAYSNETLGVTYHFPNGWTTAIEPRNPGLFDPDPKGVANLCTRTLLRIEASGTSEAGFSPWGVFFVIDPQCLGVGSFPRSDTDRDELRRFADRMSERFRSSPFISPNGVVFYASRTGGSTGPVIVSLLGQTVAGAGTEDTSLKKSPVSVTTVFAVTESQGYWVAWAAVADDPAKEDLARNAFLLPIQKEGRRSAIQAISKALTPGLK